MNEGEETAITIIRMEKLLAGITSKIQNVIVERGIKNSSLIQEIINLIELFKYFVITRMKRSHEVEHTHAINLHDCRIKIAETLSKIEALQTASEEENADSEIFLKDIIVCLNDEEKLIRNIKETSEVEIPKEIEESMSKMLIIKEQQEAQKKLLQSKIIMAEQRLCDIMEFNAVVEKKLLDECAVIEREYTNLLTKYDHDIGESHALMEKLSQDNNIVKMEIKNMEDQLVVQRTVYFQLQKEREVALMKAFTEKLELFRRNRAAKIIQKTWKSYLERISLKRRRRIRKK